METLHVLVAGVTAIILFIFGLENFSTEIQQISGDRFRRSLARVTRFPVIGVLIGAVVTAVIQSSSATSVITIGLVNAGVLSFKNSVGIIFGSNVGTTVTAQLVAFKLTAFAPLLIIAGFALSLLRTRISIFGKSIFYFGFVFFSLNLISSSLQPLQNEPVLVEYLTQPQNPLLAILIGCLFTAMVQSSSVTTGLAIIFTQQGLLGLENAVPLIMGANIGTTATALIAMFNMDLAAKKTALSHFLFNTGGVLIFLPVLLLFGDRLADIETSPAVALANIHLVFNLGTSLLFLVFLHPFTRLVERLIGEGKMDFERLPIPTFNPEAEFDSVRGDLQRNLAGLLAFLQENYNLVTLSIESNYHSVREAAGKRIDYVNFIEKEYVNYFSRVVANVKDESDSGELLALVTRYDYLFQIHDSIDDLFTTRQTMSRNYIELKSDVMLMVREISSQTLSLFDGIGHALAEGNTPDVRADARRLQALLNEVNRNLLPLLADPDRRDAGALSNFVTYSLRLKDKLLTLAGLSAPEARESREPSP
ncbi:Na/Pi cotransporter family protein [Seongchinamella sediminis]|uniref:Na/Pi cotransporter family protein n=1 Tax=Seongchinamella sediminis TaxID=2283635 RepID=A0A3L7E2Q2_9GAMM|nr:Na/Pi cotransporter family protein [Seongchinamella sediminis]RLQ22502.1 Na/Pi cotransporter family protein [Seongchinamella sediminis]